ncbi:hypothetical protein LCGC14_1839010 [marine sediment metagenome]|uniref:Phage gp6-like head-tail connector protein n=1 Tax=marine sediment metagenome TaxID=412755 RepID=A0A0F9H1Z0_9ZZZZ
MALSINVAPAVEPVSTADAKLHLRVDHAAEDALINTLIAAARQSAELFTGRAFITTTFTLTLDSFPSVIIVPRPPLQSVTHVKYYDLDGIQQEFSDTLYDVDIETEPGRIVPAYNETWPSIRNRVNAVEVRFIAGYGAAAVNVPEAIVSAILLHVGHLYEHREDVIIGTISSQMPSGVHSLLWPYRSLAETSN